MNRFNIPNPSGGFKLKAHDLNAIYDYLKSGIEGLAFKENCIITGCRPSNVFLSGLNAGISQGYVALRGEIYWVEQQIWDQILIPDPVLVPFEEVRPPSPRISADASSKNVHFTRRARVEQFGSQPIKYRVSELADYGFSFYTIYNPGDLVSISPFDIIYSVPGGWRKIGSGLTEMGYTNLKMRKIGDYLELVGCCRNTDGFALGQIFQMPNLVNSIAAPKVSPIKESIITVPLSSITPTVGPPPIDPFLVQPLYWASILIRRDGSVNIVASNIPTTGDYMLHFDNKIYLK